MSVISNLTSAYGQFMPTVRVDAARRDPPGGAGRAHTSTVEGQLRMGAPPWADPERYVRNSPLFFANKVETPILMFHGDLDAATFMTEPEEMFSALYREGKDVLFVRYWGEHHLIEQPQNQRDMWGRVFDFLEDNGVSPGAD